MKKLRRLIFLAITTTVLFTYCGVYCDSPQPEDCGIIDESNVDVRTKIPWTAAIYYRKNSKSPFNYLVNGIVLGPTTILTVFGGIYGIPFRGARSRYSLPLPWNSLVAVGLSTTDLSSKDSNSQVVQVQYILPYKGQEPENKLYHYVIYRLKSPLKLNTPYARALCLPFGADGVLELAPYLNSGFLTNNLQFIVTRLKEPSLTFQDTKKPASFRLESLNITSAKWTECRSTFRFHYKATDSFVFCGRISSEGSAIVDPQTCLTHGSAAVVKLGNRHFLRGLLSLIPARKRGYLTCPDNTLYYYGKISSHLDWIVSSLRCSPVEFPCFKTGRCVAIAAACNFVSECEDGSDEDPTFCSYQHKCINKHMCGIGGKCVDLPQICDGKADCEDASDERYEICDKLFAAANVSNSTSNDVFAGKLNMTRETGKCISPPSSEGVQIICNNPDKSERNCEDATVNTVASVNCEEYYSSKYRYNNLKMVCGANGLWTSFKPFACEPNCGILSTSFQGYLVGGKATNRQNAFPWYGAIFALQNGRYEFICGGSLIEKRIVITAAHCVFKVFSFKYTVGYLKVALAPTSSRYESNLDDPITQVFDVTRFWFPSEFNPKTLEGDIALLEINRPVKYGQYIRPVCYLPPLTFDNDLLGKAAKVAGFGLDETGELSEVLNHEIFYVTRTKSCLGKADRSNVPCIGFLNSTIASLCLGDSGGGVVFPEKKSSSTSVRQVLKGIVSGSSNSESGKCDKNSSDNTVFTVIDAYSSWIFETLESAQEDQLAREG